MRSRVSTLHNRVDAALRIGPAWIGYRAFYAARKKLGLVEKATPSHEWTDHTDAARICIPEIVAREQLAEWMQSNYDSDRIAELRQHAANVAGRRFNVFGTKVELSSWHEDPIGGLTYPADVHWSAAPTFSGVDVKRVWEPSRFAWAYDLARLHLLDPSSNSSDVFWTAFGEWLDENPPNTGINWSCGQEASIRLMAVVSACDLMRDTISEQRERQLALFASQTGKRVMSNVGYARSQKNNHHTSEAAGLVTVGCLFPDEAWAADMLSTGLKELNLACQTLVFEDGGTSQYSSNYHRVFLHGIGWSITVLRASGRSCPPLIEQAFGRMSRYWDALCSTQTGLVPLLGHDDGANVWPTAPGDHDDGRPCKILSRAILGAPVDELPGVYDESVFWAGKLHLERIAPHQRSAGYHSFPEMGVHLLWSGPYRAILRCGPLRFRPAHADQLHLDIWRDGVPLTTSPGTFSYNPSEPNAPELSDSAYHNLVSIGGADHMPRVGRFLFAKWVDGTCDGPAVEGDSVVCEGLLVIDGTEVRRRVEVTVDGVHVIDSCNNPSARVHWYPESMAKLDAEIASEVQSVRSAGYGNLRELSRKDCEFKSGQAIATIR